MPHTNNDAQNQAFWTGVVPLASGVLNPANSPQTVWDCGTAYTYASMTTVITGAPASCTIQLQGSMDGANWTTIATSTSTTGDVNFSIPNQNPFTNLRANCSAVSGGTNPTISVAVGVYFSAGASSAPSVFNVMTYGAKGDGVTDDTAAIQAAINAAFNAGGGVIYFPQHTYAINGALNTSHNGNAQLYIPVQAGTANKIQMSFVSDYGVDGGMHSYFSGTQAVTQMNKCVLLSNSNTTGAVSNGNEPCVIGGPNPTGGYGSGTATFSNMCVTWDGISIVVPNVPDHGVAGLDLVGVAQCKVKGFSCLPNATLPGTKPSGAGWNFGLRTPNNGNNDKSIIEDASVFNMTYGFIIGEHTVGQSLRAVFNFSQYEVVGSFNGVGAQHATVLQNCSSEAIANGSGRHMTFTGNGTQVLAMLDVEDGTINIVDQSSATLARGEVRVFGSFTTIAYPAASSDVKIINEMQSRGFWSSAPAVPATTVNQQNLSGRDANVIITGGTVSAVTVDGQATGLSATGDSVIVPAGKNINITYTVAPTWKWFLL